MSGPDPGPIIVAVGMVQEGVDPARLRPSRRDLSAARLAKQRQLLQQKVERWTPILVCSGGIICDGHHAVRAAFDAGQTVIVRVTPLPAAPSGLTIDQLPVR